MLSEKTMSMLLALKPESVGKNAISFVMAMDCPCGGSCSGNCTGGCGGECYGCART